MSAPLPGWYPDPENPHGRRYWTGTNWGPSAVPIAKAKKPRSAAAAALIGAFIGLLIMGGCLGLARMSSSGSPSHSTTLSTSASKSLDDQYIALLTKWAARDGYTLGDRETLIAAGHEACALMRSGRGLISASAEVMDKYGLRPGKDGPAVGTAAAEVLCPKVK